MKLEGKERYYYSYNGSRLSFYGLLQTYGAVANSCSMAALTHVN